MSIRGLIRLRASRAEMVEGIRRGREQQARNRQTIADCERENDEIETLIAENRDAIAMLDGFIRRAEPRQPTAQAAE